jgi:hypothetical protein
MLFFRDGALPFLAAPTVVLPASLLALGPAPEQEPSRVALTGRLQTFKRHQLDKAKPIASPVS